MGDIGYKMSKNIFIGKKIKYKIDTGENDFVPTYIYKYGHIISINNDFNFLILRENTSDEMEIVSYENIQILLKEETIEHYDRWEILDIRDKNE